MDYPQTPTTTSKAESLLLKINQMSRLELLTDILRHERDFRGIDWLRLINQGPAGRIQARTLAKNHLKQLQEIYEISDDDLPEFTKAYLAREDGDVQTMPEWAIDREAADKWKSAKGEELGEKVLNQLKVLQSLELTSSDFGFSQITAGIGVVAWAKKGYDIYKEFRLLGKTRIVSIFRGVSGVGLQVSKVFIATVIVAIIAEILLLIAEKEAVVYTILINMTDDDLTQQEVYIQNGRQTVQFVKNDEDNTAKVLPKREVLIDEGEVLDELFWSAIFSAQKKDYALIGSKGAYKFASTTAFPNGAYVGWDIPLTFIGGGNRCLVSTGAEESAEGFCENKVEDGSLESVAHSETATVTAKMHSGDGSEGYMSVIFETIPS